MLSQAEQANMNLEQARTMRDSGMSYREIGRRLTLTSSQLSRIRRLLSRAKAARTRLHKADPDATDRDLPITQTVLPPGLRRTLKAAGYPTLGSLAERAADPDLPGLETLPGIGPHRARLVRALLDHFDMLPGRDDLQAEIERLFPEFQEHP